MPSASVCWGIEIGASSIKAVKLEASGDEGVKVLEYAVIQHPKPLSTPGVDANDVLRVSLGALASQHDLTKATIAVSVPGHAGFARFAKLPPVDPKKVPDIVKFEAMQQIPFPLEQVEWDYQTFVSPESPEIEVGIFAITRERVNERLAMLADFGINPSYVTLSPLAVYNALAYDLQFGPQTPGTIVVDVGTTSTDLVIATPGRVWIRTFPIGGHQFTEALVNQFQLSYPKAEKLKREAEDSKHARQVFQAMRPIFTDLAQDIQRSIGYYQSLNKDANLTRLIGVGSTFNLPGLRKYLKQQLSMDVYRIEEFRRASLDGSKPGDEKSQALNAAALSLCTAYGLALQGLGLNAVGGNLMPVSVIRKAMWKEKVPWFGLAAGVAVLAGGVMFIGAARDWLQVRGEGGVVPPIIANAVRAAEDQKRLATEAGVTAAGEPDYRAANMVALNDMRGVYRQVAADVSAMLEASNERAATWSESLKSKDGEAPKAPPGPAFSVKKFATTYLPPQAETIDPYAGSGMVSGDDPLSLSKFPRIKCELDLSTSQPEARRFVDATVTRWMSANAKRPGVPYELKFVERPALVSEPRSVATAGPREAMGEGGQAAPMPGRGIPGRGVRGLEGDRDRPVVPPPGSERPAWQGMLVGAGKDEAEQHQALASVTAALEELDRSAPIQAEVSQDPVTGNITVTWWAAFIPAQPAAEGEAK
ncbi:hypothetical protein PHYC_00359 [Phycisphaerales bacterium]|nr:hypothetical protein PHYC_00359 [Phycisphaerales bacterium]